MTTQHTLGPWIVDGNVIRGDKQSNGSVSVACVLDVAYPFGRFAGESTQANARLIAAAPDLLEALKALHGWCKAEIEHFDSTGPDEWIMEKALAAIAKATGEQP